MGAGVGGAFAPRRAGCLPSWLSTGGRCSRTSRQDGFKAHVVVEPDTGQVTACAVTRAAGGRVR